jgi:molybdopterin synthase sulfur carrier subunit
MATVWIPAPLRTLANGEERIDIVASTVREAIDALEARYPGIRERLLHDDELRPGLALAIDQQVMRHGLDWPLQEASEVHFLPAIGGG